MEKGIEAFHSNNFDKAISLLNSAVKCNLRSEEEIIAYDALSEAYYQTKNYRKSIEHGNKVYSLKPLESEVSLIVDPFPWDGLPHRPNNAKTIIANL
jgi:tetratricopeptide (TPR) repeat protein